MYVYVKEYHPYVYFQHNMQDDMELRTYTVLETGHGGKWFAHFSYIHTSIRSTWRTDVWMYVYANDEEPVCTYI